MGGQATGSRRVTSRDRIREPDALNTDGAPRSAPFGTLTGESESADQGCSDAFDNQPYGLLAPPADTRWIHRRLGPGSLLHNQARKIM